MTIESSFPVGVRHGPSFTTKKPQARACGFFAYKHKESLLEERSLAGEEDL